MTAEEAARKLLACLEEFDGYMEVILLSAGTGRVAENRPLAMRAVGRAEQLLSDPEFAAACHENGLEAVLEAARTACARGRTVWEG
jgi:hypothetical protein